MPGFDKKTAGKHLQKLRKDAGFKSARAFAEHIGMPISKYTEYEQGRHGFTYEQAWEFADVLGCTLDELGGRSVPEHHYADPRQEELNSNYESMNDTGKQLAADSVKAMSSSVDLRTE